ncbi:MAG: hypothetical protein RL235_719 [Chlamydiota bacterium]|jgi:ABC-type uncharacterized transport system permease subunit
MIFGLLDQMLIALPLFFGAYVTISLLKMPDFSLESAYLCGALAGALTAHLPVGYAMLAGVGGGCFVALIVSLVAFRCKLPFLLAAIIVNGLCHGITQGILGTSMRSVQMTLPFSEHAVLMVAGVMCACVMFFVLRSKLAYAWAAFGHNRQFFECHAISGGFVKTSGIVVGYACAGLSGFLFSLSNGFVDLTMGFGVVLICLTALTLGASVIRSAKPHFVVPIVGLVLFFSIQQTLLQLGLNLKYFNAFQALVVLGAILFMARKERRVIDHLGV